MSTATPTATRMTARAYHGETDTVLLRRSRAGDGIAFDVLMRRYRADLDMLCRHYCRDEHDREELAQESMIKAWRGIGRFDARCTVTTWLYRIVANAAVDAYRRRGRAALPVDPLMDLTSGALESPEWAVVERTRLRSALALLPAPYRVVSVLADLVGCSSAEIARLVGIPESTVRTRLWRARRALRASLAEDEPAHR